MRVEPYGPSCKPAWDDFVRRSKNGTFLFLRDYMEYHTDRFHDHSLLVRDDQDRLLALLPANASATTVESHGGLTFGGFITDDTIRTPTMLAVFEAVLTHLQGCGMRALIYKAIPHIYHRVAAEEDRYALFLCDARLMRRSVTAVVDSRHRLPFQERRTRGVKKARRSGLVVRACDDFAAFWAILTERLARTHGARPVHSLAEITRLRDMFPDCIKLYGCFDGEHMRAGVVIYENAMVARTQYIAASDEGRAVGALDLLFADLLEDWYRTKPFFDFGTSDEDDRCLNRGLIDQKEGFGARAVAQDQYEIALTGWNPGTLTRVVS